MRLSALPAHPADVTHNATSAAHTTDNLLILPIAP
jgi:hypothetical protein